MTKIITFLIAFTNLLIFISCSDVKNVDSDALKSSIELKTIEVPEIDLLAAGELRTVDVHIEGQFKYALENNPLWMSIGTDNGIISFNPPKDSHATYDFKVIAESSDSKYISSSIIGSVKTININLSDDLDNAVKIEAIGTGVSRKTLRASNTYLIPKEMTVEDNSSNNIWDLLQIHFESYGVNTTLVFIDGVTNSVTKIKSPDDWKWNGAESVISKEGNLYIISRDKNTLKPRLHKYNPHTREFKFDIVEIPEEMHGVEVTPLVIGTDKKLYMAGQVDNGDSSSPHYHESCFIQLDTSDDSVKYSGGIGGIRTMPYGIAADNDYVYIKGEAGHHYILQYEKATGSSKMILEGINNERMGILQTKYGVYIEFNGSGGEHYFPYKNTLTKSDESNQLISGDWRSISPIPWDEEFPLDWTASQKKGSITVPQDPIVANLPKKAIINTQNLIPVDGNMSIFIKQPNADSWSKIEYSLETYATQYVNALARSDGKLFMATGSYGGYTTYDPNDHSFVNSSGNLFLSTYTMIEQNKKIYISGYPSGLLFEYDYSKPWTQSVHVTDPDEEVLPYTDPSLNPKYIAKLGDYGSGAHKILSSAVGADGILYFGGINVRHGNSGAFAWYNPITGEIGGTNEDFKTYQVVGLTTIRDGKYIVMSTNPIQGDDGEEEPLSGKLFVFNTETKKIDPNMYCIPLIDFPHTQTGKIVGVDGDNVIGFSSLNNGHMGVYRANLRTHKVEYLLEINAGYSTASSDGHTVLKNKNNNVIGWVGPNLIELDPISGDIKIIAYYTYPDVPNRVAVTGDATLINHSLYVSRFKEIVEFPNVQ